MITGVLYWRWRRREFNVYYFATWCTDSILLYSTPFDSIPSYSAQHSCVIPVLSNAIDARCASWWSWAKCSARRGRQVMVSWRNWGRDVTCSLSRGQRRRGRERCRAILRPLFSAAAYGLHAIFPQSYSLSYESEYFWRTFLSRSVYLLIFVFDHFSACLPGASLLRTQTTTLFYRWSGTRSAYEGLHFIPLHPLIDQLLSCFCYIVNYLYIIKPLKSNAVCIHCCYTLHFELQWKARAPWGSGHEVDYSHSYWRMMSLDCQWHHSIELNSSLNQIVCVRAFGSVLFIQLYTLFIARRPMNQHSSTLP